MFAIGVIYLWCIMLSHNMTCAQTLPNWSIGSVFECWHPLNSHVAK